MNDTIYNFCREVFHNNELVLLLNDGLAHIEETTDSFVIVLDVQGYEINLSEIKNVKWLNEDILFTFECDEGCFEVRVLKKYFCERSDFV